MMKRRQIRRPRETRWRNSLVCVKPLVLPILTLHFPVHNKLKSQPVVITGRYPILPQVEAERVRPTFYFCDFSPILGSNSSLT